MGRTFKKLHICSAFASSDRWVRVSLSYQLNQQFLAVDEQVCLLSPNAHAVDPAELYRITATNVREFDLSLNTLFRYSWLEALSTPNIHC